MTVLDNLVLGGVSSVPAGRECRRGPGTGLPEIPASSRAEDTACCNIVGRRTADVGARPGLDVAAEIAAAGRAEPWPGSSHRQRNIEIISALKAAGVSILLVEQNARAALSVADYGYVLETGDLVLEGPARGTGRQSSNSGDVSGPQLR